MQANLFQNNTSLWNTQKTNNKIKTNVCLKHKNYVPPYINQVSLVAVVSENVKVMDHDAK